MNVVAAHDIVTEAGFAIARAGNKGVAQRGAKPHDETNCGKVLVLFNGRKHGYWVSQYQLLWPRSVSVKHYVAVCVQPAKLPALPRAKPIAYHFGNNLAFFRRSRGLSQGDLGDKMTKNGYAATQSTISYNERQPRGPRGEFTDAVAEALEVPAFAFYIDTSDTKVFDHLKKFTAQLSSSLCEG